LVNIFSLSSSVKLIAISIRVLNTATSLVGSTSFVNRYSVELGACIVFELLKGAMVTMADGYVVRNAVAEECARITD